MKKLFTLLSVFVLIAHGATAITLDECYQKARTNYPLIQQYQLTERLKEYSFTNASSAWIPQLMLSGQATYQSAVTEFPDEMTAMYEKVGLDIHGLSRDQYKLMLALTQTIWDGGTSKAQKDIARADADIANLQVEKELAAWGKGGWTTVSKGHVSVRGQR